MKKNVIQLLEKLGQQAVVNAIDNAECEELVLNAKIDSNAEAAILGSDIEALASMLDTSQKIVAFLLPAEEEQEDEDEDKEDDGKKENNLNKLVISN